MISSFSGKQETLEFFWEHPTIWSIENRPNLDILLLRQCSHFSCKNKQLWITLIRTLQLAIFLFYVTRKQNLCLWLPVPVLSYKYLIWWLWSIGVMPIVSSICQNYPNCYASLFIIIPYFHSIIANYTFKPLLAWNVHKKMLSALQISDRAKILSILREWLYRFFFPNTIKLYNDLWKINKIYVFWMEFEK